MASLLLVMVVGGPLVAGVPPALEAGVGLLPFLTGHNPGAPHEEFSHVSQVDCGDVGVDAEPLAAVRGLQALPGH